MNILIWTYHRVLPAASSAAVSADEFERQIAYLAESGYKAIGPAELELFFNGRLPRYDKYTMITFDDGWADNLIWATPILKRYSAKAVLALNTGLMNKEGRSIRKDGNYEIIDSKKALEESVYGKGSRAFLNWNEILDMKNSGVWEFQAHGNSHFGCYSKFDKIKGFFPEKPHWTMEYALGEPPFPGAPKVSFRSTLAGKRTVMSGDLKDSLKKASGDSERTRLCQAHPAPVKVLETDEEFEMRVEADLSECKKTLLETLGVETSSLFWPWGQSSEASVRIAKKCGFKMLFTMEKDIVTRKTSPDHIPRIAAPANFADFKKQLTIYSNSIFRKIKKFF
ncbi:MAG: polysaccharide deacetylase family protein [Victivallales bacterium]